MGHDHGHGHGHGHAHGAAADGRRLTIALVITALVLVSGAVGAWITGSLSLLADLGHQVTDVAALVTAVVAARLAQRPPSARRTFGLGRSEVLGAAVNALALLAVTVWVAVEAVERLLADTPPEVPGLALLVFGAVGLVGNLVSLAVLSGGTGSLNVRGAALHVLGDALGSVAVMVAAGVVLLTGWPYADVVASLVIVAILVPRTVTLLSTTAHVLLEGTPPGTDVEEIRAALLAVPGVQEVHDLHVWVISDRVPAASAHLVVDEDATPHCEGRADGASVLDRAGEALRERFGIDHSTLQIETAEHADHEEHCAPPPVRGAINTPVTPRQS
ncbi:cation diffusion facilitator family transporter [Actinomycetospora termitidis]|uniref:Cation diffusion facilitator family transporter n=1 Tax=Actinomycetospora termitidis TaxID=3053470 RepID=A0ABT7MD79_9PSEU|nr:cation diffusion facilitator family transporter [Actinomycetospora sp. Odt1-22]MDL5158625.1 cation diffusion facilitator family transporter [Actinomycetospora sp. Odt1-22]